MFFYFTIITDTVQQKDTKPVTWGQLLQMVQKNLTLLTRVQKQASRQSLSERDFLRGRFLSSNSFFFSSSANRGKMQLNLLRWDEDRVPGVKWLWQLLEVSIILFHPGLAPWVAGATKMCLNPSVAAILLSITVRRKLGFYISINDKTLIWNDSALTA